MTSKTFYTLIGAGAAVVTLSAVATPADAFTINATSATWDNVTLSSGYVIGSDGYEAAYWNSVEHIDVGNQTQVRFGDSEFADFQYWDFDWDDYYAGYAWGSQKIYDQHGYSHTYYYNYDYVDEYTQKSGLGFEGVSSLDINVNDVFSIGTLTHFNQSIWANGNDAVSAEISLDLDFSDLGIGTRTFDFTIAIDETLNNAAVCPYETDAGKGCSDEITWDWVIDESSSFMYEDEEYTLELIGFADSMTSPNIVNSFISQENGDNSASIFARLVKVDNTQDIPEPASLLGLAGLVFYFARSRRGQSDRSFA